MQAGEGAASAAGMTFAANQIASLIRLWRSTPAANRFAICAADATCIGQVPQGDVNIARLGTQCS
jgi:hypothetical protein